MIAQAAQPAQFVRRVFVTNHLSGRACFHAGSRLSYILKTAMRKLIISSSIILITLSACQNSESPKPVAKQAFNAVCPISGEPVSPKSQTVEYEGKVYGFCCDSCEPKFKAEPAKYSLNVSADGKRFLGEKEPMH